MHPKYMLGALNMKEEEGKDKFILEQAMKAQRDSKRYSSTLSLTLVLDGGGWFMPCPLHFTPGKDLVPIV